MSIIGLDIGGSKLACVEGTADGGILARREAPTRASEPFATRFPEIVTMVDRQLAEARAAGRRVSALSVSVGGPLKISEGRLLNPPHLPGWHNVEAGRRMGRGLALLIDALNPQVIVLGSLAVALGERILGPARQVVADEALPQATAVCEIRPSALGARIGDVASLMAALTQRVCGPLGRR